MSINDFLRIVRGATMISSANDNLLVLQIPQGLFGVISKDGIIVVPFGKYDWIEKYDFGVARIKKGKETNGNRSPVCKWGIIDTNGCELLPTEYDDLWITGNDNHRVVNTCKDGIENSVLLSQLLSI